MFTPATARGDPCATVTVTVILAPPLAWERRPSSSPVPTQAPSLMTRAAFLPHAGASTDPAPDLPSQMQKLPRAAFRLPRCSHPVARRPLLRTSPRGPSSADDAASLHPHRIASADGGPRPQQHPTVPQPAADCTSPSSAIVSGRTVTPATRTSSRLRGRPFLLEERNHPTWAASCPRLSLRGARCLQAGSRSRAAGTGMGGSPCCDFLRWQRWQQLSGFLWCKQEARQCQNGSRWL